MDGVGSLGIRRVLDWLLGLMGPHEWRARREAIEAYLESVLQPRDALSGPEAAELLPVAVNDDRIGWYLYLAHTALAQPTHYEPTQGARVLPVFERLGTDFDLLMQVEGVEQRAYRLLSAESDNPDSRLFEILVALTWKRNGWPRVAFVPEAPPEKRPDIEARSRGARWVIECKRLAKSSRYSQEEREKWLRMWRHLSDHLVSRRMPVVLKITFHVELHTLPDELLRDELAGKLPLAVLPCTLMSDERWDVRVKAVDLQAVREHLRRYYVRFPSEQLNDLIAGPRDPGVGFSSVIAGRGVRAGAGPGYNRFLDTLDFAAGACWHCDADRAIEHKARDIRSRLAGAVQQLPKNEPAVVHVGLETLDGVLVEAKRYERILKSLGEFKARGKDLQWVYCHLYQSEAPLDQTWAFDETVYRFSHRRAEPEPLARAETVVPETSEGVHWMRGGPQGRQPARPRHGD